MYKRVCPSFTHQTKYSYSYSLTFLRHIASFPFRVCMLVNIIIKSLFVCSSFSLFVKQFAPMDSLSLLCEYKTSGDSECTSVDVLRCCRWHHRRVLRWPTASCQEHDACIDLFLTLLLPGWFLGQLYGRLGTIFWNFTFFVPIIGGVEEEEHAYKFSDISKKLDRRYSH